MTKKNKNTPSEPAAVTDQLANELIAQLGKYDVVIETPEGKATQLGEQQIATLLDQDGLDALYKGATQASTQKRAEFITLFKDNIQVDSPQKIKDQLITLEGLLGKRGLAAYKAAIEEERNSVAFRNAAFLKSTMLYEGEQWRDPFVVYVGGPSSAGKTFCTKTVLEEYTKNRPVQKGKTEGNLVVSVDGGVDRELSQIRQFALQLALSQGYKGIKDLHNVSTAVKEYVWKAAKKQNLSQIIPSTCVAPDESYRIHESMQQCKDKNIEQAFIMVKADKETVRRMGEERAWAPVGVDAPTSVSLKKGKISCESKVYEPQHFDKGVRASKWKAVRFGRKGRHFSVKNDLIYVKEKTVQGNWEKASPKDQTQGLVRLPERDFEAWKALPGDKVSLEHWLKEQQQNKRTSKPLVQEGRFDKSQGKVIYGQGGSPVPSSVSTSSLTESSRSMLSSSASSFLTVASAPTSEEEMVGISFEPIAPLPAFGVPASSQVRDIGSPSPSTQRAVSPGARSVSPLAFTPIAPDTLQARWERICTLLNDNSRAEKLEWKWNHQGKEHHLEVQASHSQPQPHKLSVQMAEPITVQTKVPENPADAALAQLKRLATLSSELVKEKLVPQDRQAVIYGGKNLENAVMLYQTFHAQHPKMPIVWSSQYNAAQQEMLNKMLLNTGPAITPRSGTGKGAAGG